MSKIYADNILFFFSSEKKFDISCRFSPKGTLCLKCQTLFYGKRRKNNIISLPSAELAVRALKLDFMEEQYRP